MVLVPFKALVLVPISTAFAAPAAFDIVDANKTLHLAWAAFCNESAVMAWDCQWCSGPDAYAEPLETQAYLTDKRAGTQGYVAVDRPRRRVVVAYRGSADLANTLQDSEFWMAPLPFGPAGLLAGRGFLTAYASVRGATAKAIAEGFLECGKDCALIFTGHSLGAAMATIGAAEHAGGSAPVGLYTFGSPRVGNKAFASWAHSRLARHVGTVSIRMRRQGDIVPALPPRSVGYAHVPTEVWNTHSNSRNDAYIVCDGGGSGEDSHCGDSEEHPPFPLDLVHLSPAEHTRYMGFQGGGCRGG